MRQCIAATEPATFVGKAKDDTCLGHNSDNNSNSNSNDGTADFRQARLQYRQQELQGSQRTLHSILCDGGDDVTGSDDNNQRQQRSSSRPRGEQNSDHARITNTGVNHFNLCAQLQFRPRRLLYYPTCSSTFPASLLSAQYVSMHVCRRRRKANSR